MAKIFDHFPPVGRQANNRDRPAIAAWRLALVVVAIERAARIVPITGLIARLSGGLRGRWLARRAEILVIHVSEMAAARRLPLPYVHQAIVRRVMITALM